MPPVATIPLRRPPTPARTRRRTARAQVLTTRNSSPAIGRPTPRSMTATITHGDRAAEGARPRRPRRRRQSDRLLLPQARRLQAFASVVRARLAGRSEPRADLAVLRPLASRTGQPRPGAISFEPDRPACRHRQRRISLARRRPGKVDWHRARLLIFTH